MKRAPQQKAARDAEIIAAERALAGKRYSQARHHLSEAERLGAPERDIRRLKTAVNLSEKMQTKRAKMSAWGGFFLGVPCYLFLSFRQPPAWTYPVWVLLAFVLIPALIGYATGRWRGHDAGVRSRFRAGMRACFWVMAFYTGLTLLTLRLRVGSFSASFTVWLFVTILYALLAGTVAGLVSGYLTWRDPKPEAPKQLPPNQEEAHEPTS